MINFLSTQKAKNEIIIYDGNCYLYGGIQATRQEDNILATKIDEQIPEMNSSDKNVNFMSLFKPSNAKEIKRRKTKPKVMSSEGCMDIRLSFNSKQVKRPAEDIEQDQRYNPKRILLDNLNAE